MAALQELNEAEIMSMTDRPTFNMTSGPTDKNNLTANMDTLRMFHKLKPHELAPLCILSLTAVVLNVTVILGISRRRRLRKKVTNVYVVSLCLTQILVSGLVLPSFCVPHLAVAIAHDHFTALAVVSYALNLCAVTRERHIAISHSLRYQELVHYSRAVKTVLFAWIIAFLVQITPVLWVYSGAVAIVHEVYLIFVVVVFLILPLVYLVYAYSAIFFEIKALLKRDKQNSIRSSKKKKTDKGRPCSLCKRKPRRRFRADTQLTGSTKLSTTSSLYGRLNFSKNSSTVTSYKLTKIVAPHLQNLEHSSVMLKKYKVMHSLTTDSLPDAKPRDGTLRRVASDNQLTPIIERKASRCSLCSSCKSKASFHRSKRHSNTKKVAAVFCCTTFTYSMTWFPVLYMTFLQVVNRTDLEPSNMRLVSAFLIGVNSVIDPLLYGVCLKDVRKSVASMLCRKPQRNNAWI